MRPLFKLDQSELEPRNTGKNDPSTLKKAAEPKVPRKHMLKKIWLAQSARTNYDENIKENKVFCLRITYLKK